MSLPSSAKPLVLLVEDDANDVFFFEMAVRRAGFDILLRVASDGSAAMNYLAGEGVHADREVNPPPRLVVLDLNLPCRNGLEVLRWMREHPAWRDCPVVILSSSLSQEDANAAAALGVVGYHVKPTEPRLLPDIVREIFAKCLPELGPPRTVLP